MAEKPGRAALHGEQPPHHLHVEADSCKITINSAALIDSVYAMEVSSADVGWYRDEPQDRRARKPFCIVR